MSATEASVQPFLQGLDAIGFVTGMMQDIDTLVRDGLRRNIAPIVTGAIGIGSVSTLALLAAGSLVPLLAPLATGNLTVAVVAGWLGSIGGNALASWLDTWARSALGRVTGNALDAEQRLLVDLARDLQQQLTTNDALATDLAVLVERTDILPAALAALNGQSERQIRLLQLLLEDVQSSTFRNERLHDITLKALLAQAEMLRSTLAQSETSMQTAIEAVLLDVRRLRMAHESIDKQKAPISTVHIGGHVGTYQSVQISGGAVHGSIVGSQSHSSTAPPSTSEQSIVAVSQEHIDEQHTLLDAHRRTLAVYLRRLAKQGSANIAPEVFHGIREAQNGIRRCKATLRSWNVAVIDHPDDEAPLP